MRYTHLNVAHYFVVVSAVANTTQRRYLQNFEHELPITRTNLHSEETQCNVTIKAKQIQTETQQQQQQHYTQCKLEPI